MMEIDKELDDLLNDSLLDISDKERALFDIPDDMKRVKSTRKNPDYVAQRKPCEDFSLFEGLFKQIHADLKYGRRSLVRISKTYNLTAGHYYIVEGQMVLLQETKDLAPGRNGSLDGRTRCIYENGTESDIMLQTLRRSVVSDGYAIIETEDEMNSRFFVADDLTDNDKVSGYIYVLSSRSANQDIANKKDLYKVGFTINSVEERISNADNDPTYLLAPVKIEASYKILNLNSHIFETLIHQVLDGVQLQITIKDKQGKVYHPKEWYVAPLPVIDKIIQKILDGSITDYTYNAEQKCLEKHIVQAKSTFDVSNLKVLSLVIKKIYFDEIMSGEKTIEYRELKQTTMNKYTYIDSEDNKRYLRRYDALRLYVGYDKNRESALVEVSDITYNEGVVEYHLGNILEHIAKSNE